MDSYGDGNVYRGQVLKDSEIKTIEINRVRFDKTKNAINRKHMFLSEPEAESGDYYHSESVERLVEAARELCAKLNFVHEHESYKAIWYLAHSHYGDYKGPKYEQEFNELKAALEPFNK